MILILHTGAMNKILKSLCLRNISSKLNSKGGNNATADISITYPLSINFGEETLGKKNLAFMEVGQ